MTSPNRHAGLHAHIEKHRRRGWFCVVREISARGDYRGLHGPFSMKRDARAFKASAKKNYEISRKGQ